MLFTFYYVLVRNDEIKMFNHKIPKLSMMYQSCILQDIYFSQQASYHILRVKLGPYSFSLSTTIRLVR